MIFYAKNEAGLLTFTNKKELYEFMLENMSYKGLYVVDIKKESTTRTLNQNEYLWGVVYKLIGLHTGHAPTELHEIYKRMFITPKFITYKGKEIKVAGGTSDMNKIEFSEYVNRVIAEGSSMGVIIPPPEKKKEDEFNVYDKYKDIEEPKEITAF